MFLATLALLALSLPGQEAPTEMTIRTAKGEVIQAVLKTKSFKIKTDFGSAEVGAPFVSVIEFGEPDVLITKTKVELRGKLQLSSLKVEVDGKKKTLRRKDLVSMVAGAAPGTGFDGRWSTTLGPMTLEQQGVRVTGTYGWEDGATIEGMIEGDTLEFEWRRSGGNKGKGSLSLWEGDQTFTGTLRYGGNEEFCGGYRLNPVRAATTPGQVTEGQTESMLNYYLHVPKGFSPEKKYNAIAFFHGSNMSSRDYVETIVSTWPKLAEEYLVLGFDGERLSSASSEGSRVYNATYINYSGHEVGEPWRYNQTPGLAAASLREIAEFLPIERWFVGGHSQGGFLTYAIGMFYPDLVAGIFPMSCSLLVQCEPSYFDDADTRAAQRRMAIAHIHGETDNLVEFTSGIYCSEAFQDADFPRLRLFTDPTAGHRFMFLPVEEAVRWLEVMSSGDTERLVSLAEERLKEKDTRDAAAAARIARELGVQGKLADRVAAVMKKVDAAAEKEAKTLETVIARNANGRWVDAFWDFRRDFGTSDRAVSVLEAYAKLREEHQPEAERLFREARNEQNDSRREKKQREIVEKWYASSYYKLVSRWLD